MEWSSFLALARHVIGFLGMINMCTGAAGLMSLNARQRSSSYTTSAGIALSMIFLKIVISLILHNNPVICKDLYVNFFPHEVIFL